MSLGYSKTDFTPNSLIAGSFPVQSKSATIASGAGVLTAGTLLGKITASGKYQKSLAAAVDGSEVPVAILSEDVDASSADVVTIIYETGEFNINDITFGTGHTEASVTDALRTLSIFFKTPVAR